MRKSVNIRWYQRLPHVEIMLVPVKYSHPLEGEFEHLTGLSCHKW